MARSSNRSSASQAGKGARSNAQSTSHRAPGQIRIIAGQYRGRKLPVPDVEALRPTGDRVRETLFNWLQTVISGSDCLDLFAGSGALGFEAASRYAKSVTLVEKHHQAFNQLENSVRTLANPNIHVHCSTAEAFLTSHKKSFDVVFVDPPFSLQCQWPVLERLVKTHLNEEAWVYIESPRSQAVPLYWPSGCELHREKNFGDVTARLIHAKHCIT